MAKKDAQKYIQMLQDETDPDKIQILELDIQRELGLDPKDLKDDVVKKMGGGYMGGMFSGDEVLAAGNSKGGRKALKGIKFKGVL